MSQPRQHGSWITARVFLLALGAWGGGAAHAQQQIMVRQVDGGGQQLGPARFQPRQDGMGFIWDINPRGVVVDGTDDCFDDGLALIVNGQQFFAQQPMATADGNEMVLKSQVQGVEITRRILIDTARSAARYVEVFRNATPREVRLSVAVRSMLGANCERVVSSSGAPFGGDLGKKDCGFMTLPPANDNRPAVMFLVGEPRGTCKPTIMNQDNRTFTVAYTLAAKPNSTVSLLHYCAQRRGIADATVPNVFRPFYKGRLVNPQIPKELRATVANFAAGQAAPDEGEPGLAIQALVDLCRSLEVERGKSDVLVVDEEARLVGTATGAGLTVETSFGKADVALGDVGLLWGGAGVGRPMRLYLRNGEVLAGKIEAKALKFKAEAGPEVALTPEQTHALILHADALDGRPPGEAAAFLSTHLGDNLALARDKALTLEAATAWGRLKVPFDQLNHLVYTRDPMPGHRLAMTDRSRLSVFLCGDKIQAKTIRFGDIQLAPNELAGLVRVKGKPKEGAAEPAEPEPGEIASPHFVLAGENLVVGAFDAPELQVLTAAGLAPVDPKKIRSIERREGDEGAAAPAFTFELIGGGKLAGRFEERVVPIRWGETVLRVPVQHVLSFQVPEKAPKEEEKEPGKGVIGPKEEF